jgi:hypothetical protein
MLRKALLSLSLASIAAALALPPAALAREDAPGGRRARMSAMGQAAAQVRGLPLASLRAPGADKVANICFNQIDCGESPAPGGQAETTIAVDATGQHVVIGFNDTRGFDLPVISLSGFQYSDDGGRTFTDGGQLPSGGFQAVFGDPDIRYLGACSFVYSSILINVAGLQTMCVHRSTDCGHTWEGPFEVTSASIPGDDADKEFIDVDPETGRVLMSWTNFTATAAEISTTFSDDVLTAAVPTWSPRQIVAATDLDGQSSIARFAGNRSGNAYIAWRRFPGFYTSLTGFARSTDNGATWSAPVNLTATEFVTADQVLGNDRIDTSPGLAVDNSRGRHRGNVYVVYGDNDSLDGADIVFQRSTDGGLTFSAPVALNARPGADRSQWFPWVTVDPSSGRVYVFYYDQGVASSGDLSQLSYTFSDDGGRSFSPPRALSDRPFHAGWGNDTGQPNLGDYHQAVAQRGRLYAAVAITAPPPAGFADGQPGLGMTVPDVVVQVLPSADHPFGAPPVDLQGVAIRDSGRNGAIDPGETVGVTFTLRNYVTNPMSAEALAPALGVLSTTTSGVQVPLPLSVWPRLAPGQSAGNRLPFLVRTLPGFVPGTPIELVLTYFNDGSRTVLRHRLFTGTPQPTTLLAESFDTPVAATGLPAGWSSRHGAGANTVPWVTAAGAPGAPGFCGTTSGAAFHQNANDGPPGVRPSRWERLFSPLFTVPADAEYVTVDFDVCTDTEEDPVLPTQGYDGVFLRVTDVTTGRTLRSVLAEAFADEFTTGALFHYPRHFPRSGDPFYFEDMSAWSGDSGGPRHVHLRLPGMAGSTAQLRFEYAQDSSGTCADLRPGHTCGVSIDNLVVQSVKSAPAQP